MNDARDHRDHLVTDDAATAGRRTGRYVAVCGATVLVASRTVPERGHCPLCTRRAAR